MASRELGGQRAVPGAQGWGRGGARAHAGLKVAGHRRAGPGAALLLSGQCSVQPAINYSLREKQ